MSMVELLILGLISEEPRHGYDIIREFRDRGYANWSRISEISIYKALERLEARGLVVSSGQRQGKMPERKVFHLTDRGRERLADLEYAHLSSEEPIYHYYLLPLQFLETLPYEQSQLALEKRLTFLQGRIDALERHMQAVSGIAGEIQMLSAQRLLELYKGEVSWLKRLIMALQDARRR